jgi:hypothetical protein
LSTEGLFPPCCPVIMLMRKLGVRNDEAGRLRAPKTTHCSCVISNFYVIILLVFAFVEPMRLCDE